MGIHQSFDNLNKKFRTTWDNARENENIIKNNNNFIPLVITKSSSTTLKKISTVTISNNLSANDGLHADQVDINDFREQDLEFIYPIAFVRSLNTGITTLNANFDTINFDYIYYKINDTKFVFRYIVDSIPRFPNETSPPLAWTVQLVFFNYRIYDNLQKGRI